jgi:DNA polymerase
MTDDAPLVTTLGALAGAEARCTRCPLYRFATQVVPGAGPRTAELMLVGEQPGNDEDLVGKPFVGPAGRVLDKALADARIDRRAAFVTNAVKHFKFEQRGKRRLHKKPNAYEIQRCRWWYERERAIIRPKLTVALGATAARSVFQKAATIASLRGKFVRLEDGGHATATVHPSYLLRIDDPDDKRAQYRLFVADLKRCASFLLKLAA